MQYKLTSNDLMLVLALVRTGTLAEASLRLNVDSSTVFRQLQRLERDLAAKLFERSRTGYLPTEFAKHLATHAERIETELEIVHSSLQTYPELLSGSVRITSTDSLMHGLVIPVVNVISSLHPHLEFDLHTSNEIVNLNRREADIALRATRSPPGYLVGKQLGVIEVVLAAPLSSNLSSMADVLDNKTAWIAPDDALPEHPSVLWRKREFPKIKPSLRANSIETLAELIAAGLGVGLLPRFLVNSHPNLKAISEPIKGCETGLWLLTHPESRHLTRVASVFRLFAEHIRLSN